MQHWETLHDLLDLYGVDYNRGGGQLFDELVTKGRMLRYTSRYTVRDLAAGIRTDRKWSPLVYASIMKRALVPLLYATPGELEALGLTVERLNVYDLAEAIIDVLPCELDELEYATGQGLAGGLVKLGILPRPSNAEK